MQTLIIDRFAHQPIFKRVLWTSLTGFGWAFWISLWVPLLQTDGTLAESDAIGQLLATLGSHAALILTAAGLFLAWSMLQSLGGAEPGEAAGAPTSVRQLAQSVRIREEDLHTWQRARRMVVFHDDSSGWIREVRCS